MMLPWLFGNSSLLSPTKSKNVIYQACHILLVEIENKYMCYLYVTIFNIILSRWIENKFNQIFTHY